jgi:G protein-coupled glucose receptor regulating Gpa2.
MYDKYEDSYKTIYKVQICTGSISFLASLAMATGIQLSKRKLSTPYRRLVYGLCMSDILQSISLMTGPFASPAETPYAFWARGNIATCNVNGFMFSIGFTAVPMYVLALGVYYLCKLKRRMPDREFRVRYEIWIHSFIIVWHLATNIGFLVTKHFNPGRDGGTCFVNHYPSRCNVVPEVGECQRGLHAGIISTIFLLGPCATCFLGICYCMARLVQHAFLLLILSPSRREESLQEDVAFEEPQPAQDTNDKTEALDEIEVLGDVSKANDQEIIFHDVVATAGSGESKDASKVSNDDCISDSSERKTDARNRAAKLQELSILYRKEMVTNAILFIGVFFIIYLVPLLLWIHNVTKSKVSYSMLILSAILYPLGGFFNILVHTRSNIAALRRRDKGQHKICWLYAFFAVLLAGGDTPTKRKVSVSPSNNESSSHSSIKYGITN